MKSISDLPPPSIQSSDTDPLMSRANYARVQSLFIPWLPRGMHWARGERRIQAESPVPLSGKH